jgi:hypothetical protein
MAWSTISMAQGMATCAHPLAKAVGGPSPFLNLDWGIERCEKSHAVHASAERCTGLGVVAGWCPAVLLRHQAVWEAGEAHERMTWRPIPHEVRRMGTTRHH